MEHRSIEVPAIHNEDCLDTVKSLTHVDYVIFSPADISDNIEGITNYDEYWSFMRNIFTELTKISDIVTLVITDRKINSEILQKHTEAIKIFKELGWKHKHHKIWVKSYKSNMYVLNYAHIMTFVSNKHKMPKTAMTIPDVFHYEIQNARHFNIELPKTLIDAYTKEGDLVYDPMIGSGTTALACIELGRKCIGSEIDKNIYGECMENLK